MTTKIRLLSSTIPITDRVKNDPCVLQTTMSVSIRRITVLMHGRGKEVFFRTGIFFKDRVELRAEMGFSEIVSGRYIIKISIIEGSDHCNARHISDFAGVLVKIMTWIIEQ